MNFGLSNNNSPFFSIIIPTFNSERTLSSTLCSVLNQSFSNYELLIMDGGSNDKTVDLVNKFNDSRIRIISESDNGVYDAMNKGIKISQGQWIYFLGSDDTFFNAHVLNDVKLLLELDDVDVVYGNVFSTQFNCLYDGEFYSEKLLIKNICHQAIFFKKNIFNKIGQFDQHFKILADWDFNFKWFYNSNIKKRFINLTIAEYADGGLSSINYDKSFFLLKDWVFMKVNKNNFSRHERFVFFLNQISILYKLRRKRDLLKVFLDFPYLIF